MLLLFPVAIFCLHTWNRVIGNANPSGLRLYALGVKYLSAYTSIAILLYFKRFFQNKNNVTTWISKNSLGYYSTQSLYLIPFCGKLGMQNDSFANQALLFCIVVAGATVTIKLLHKYIITEVLLLGKVAYPIDQPAEDRALFRRVLS